MKLHTTISLSILFLVTVSCASTKFFQRNPIYGSSYKIISVTEAENIKPQLHCFAFDINDYKPCAFANVILTSDDFVLKINEITDRYGNLELDMPAGKYKLEVHMLGNESVIIREINFKPYTRTEIKFDLGAVDTRLL